MRRAGIIALVAGIAAASFIAGRSGRRPDAGDTGRRILYYQDPMHPSYTSARPGIAPDCGMRLEPVYAGGTPAPATRRNAVYLTDAQQHLIGIHSVAVESGTATSRLRTVGRVAVDDRRVYRLNAAVDGWIREAAPVATGSHVRAGDRLAAFYAPDFLAAEQALIFAAGAMDRFVESGRETEGQITLTRANIQSTVDTLRNLGMNERQVAELKRTRALTQLIEIASPVDGFVLVRNISPGQRFERGAEWYRIADLSHVWVFADVFAHEAGGIHPGDKARVTVPATADVVETRVADVLPQIDPVTRTIKVRLDIDNRHVMLRPDAFVDVEFATSARRGLLVPAEAILDAGTRRVVFVDHHDGYFEPRAVVTGARTADQVEIVDGLAAGEQVVVSGNFLLDSETRLKLGPAAASADAAIDPSCGMPVDRVRATAAALVVRAHGVSYYFCSDDCRRRFGAGATETGDTPPPPRPAP